MLQSGVRGSLLIHWAVAWVCSRSREGLFGGVVRGWVASTGAHKRYFWAKMPYLLTIMVDLTSETCRTIVSNHALGKFQKPNSTMVVSIRECGCLGRERRVCNRIRGECFTWNYQPAESEDSGGYACDRARQALGPAWGSPARHTFIVQRRHSEWRRERSAVMYDYKY